MTKFLVQTLLALGLATRLVHPASAAPAGQVTVTQSWMRYLLPGTPAAGYMNLHNAGDAPVLVTGASSPACGSLMLHQSSDSGGMAMMMAVPQVSVPAHGSLSLAPGGYHLMCMAPHMAVGGKVKITLQFADGGSVDAMLPVYGAQGSP